MSTRRQFCSDAALSLLAAPLLRRSLCAQAPSSSLAPSSTSVDVGAVDHDRILNAANRYLTQSPAPLTAFTAPHSPGTTHDFFSEASEERPVSTPSPSGAASPASAPFTAHRDALLNFSIQFSALAAAFVLTSDARYAGHAADHLRAWFVHPESRMNPSLPYAQLLPGTPKPRMEGILDTVHLAEVAQGISFIARSDALSADELAAVYQWFADYLNWLGTDRAPLLARDQKNHHGASWLLQAAAYARLQPDTTGSTRKVPPPPSNQTLAPPPNEVIQLTALRHLLRTITLRAQISPVGTFRNELTTPWPYRNSLFTLDIFAGICSLLSTRFDSAWAYEMQEGPGMHVAIAYHFPFIANRGAWPYRADLTRFTELPLRQPSLLLAGRAYSRPEYIDLWKTLPPDPTDPVLQHTFPIRQPLLWVRRAPAL